MKEIPVSIRLQRLARTLEFEWADGVVAQVASQALREACRCAECVALRRNGAAKSVSDDIAVTDIEPCGAGAIRLHFSDGHARGIYPFAYMRELALI